VSGICEVFEAFLGRGTLCYGMAMVKSPVKSAVWLPIN